MNATQPTSRLFLAAGLMSGTSADGVDAAALLTDGEYSVEYLDSITCPYPQAFRDRLIRIARSDQPLTEVLRLERDLTEAHATAIDQLRERVRPHGLPMDVVGFHGHTIRHLPLERLTWQLGDASRLAELTGLPVVADFRRRDLAAGGQGAPLVPLYHAALLRHVPKPVVVLNLGGVGNATFLGEEGEILAGDTGPGCGVLDLWTMQHSQRPFDSDGTLASGGLVHPDRVAMAMADEFFQRPFPKSADRFEFDDRCVADLSPADGAATLCAITAESARVAIALLPKSPQMVYVTGGGTHHPVLMRELRQRFRCVENISVAGPRPDSLEAECFAWLAVRHLRGLPFSMPSTTGCHVGRVGGVRTM